MMIKYGKMKFRIHFTRVVKLTQTNRFQNRKRKIRISVQEALVATLKEKMETSKKAKIKMRIQIRMKTKQLTRDKSWKLMIKETS